MLKGEGEKSLKPKVWSLKSKGPASAESGMRSAEPRWDGEEGQKAGALHFVR